MMRIPLLTVLLLLVSPAIAGAAAQGFLGVQLEQGDGSVTIGAVMPETPASKAGLASGDRVVSFAGTPITEARQIVEGCTSRKPGMAVDVVVVRDGAEVTLEVTLGIRPDMAQAGRTWLLNKPAPAWTAKRLADDAEMASDQLEGKVIVIDFWAYWCGPCIAAIPEVNKLAERFAGEDVAGVGITHEPRADSVEIGRRMTYPSLYDAPGRSDADYFVAALPTLVVVDRAGVVREVRVGGGDLGTIEALVKKLLDES